MNKTISYLYLSGALFIPSAIALAHGGEVDGHVETEVVDVVDPTGRKYVMIGVAVVFALLIAWFVNSKMKSGPPPTQPPTTSV